MMQAMPDVRQQSFDEIYGPPENFLEIEVGLAICLGAIVGWRGGFFASPLFPCDGI
jgi:hypothetical protein